MPLQRDTRRRIESLVTNGSRATGFYMSFVYYHHVSYFLILVSIKLSMCLEKWRSRALKQLRFEQDLDQEERSSLSLLN